MNTIEVQQTIIYLSETDAEAYKAFMRNYENFMFLFKNGAFKEQQGQVIFNRNEKGKVIDVSVTNRYSRMSN